MMTPYAEMYRQGQFAIEEPLPQDSWPQKAMDIVHGPRQESYAHPLINFLRIAIAWSEWLMARGKLARGTAVDPDDVAMMMSLMKIAGRETHAHSDDNPIDTIGYLYCWQRIDDAMRQLMFLDGMDWFRGKKLSELVALLEELTGE